MKPMSDRFFQPRRRIPAVSRRTAGLSLMEMMVVIGIMMFLLVIITQIFALNYDIFAKQSKRTDNEVGAILTAKTISQMARGALSVEASRTIDGTLYTSSDSQLVLKMPAVDAANNIIVNAFDYVAFFRSPTQPTRIMAATEADAGSVRQTNTRLITDFNTALVFRYNNPVPADADRVSLLVINTQTQRSLTLTTKGWTSIFLRNR